MNKNVFKNFIVSLSEMVFIIFLMFMCCENSSAEIKPVTIKIPFSVVETKDGNKVGDKFLFELQGASESAPKPLKAVVKCSYLEEKNFSIAFDKVGKYYYTLKQIKGNNKNISKYDDIVYTIGILVYYKDDGSVGQVIKVKRNSDKSKPGKITFKNLVKIHTQGEIDTGDRSELIPWIIICSISVSFVLILILRKFRNRK